jgi:hypothetical protein
MLNITMLKPELGSKLREKPHRILMRLFGAMLVALSSLALTFLATS